MRITKDWLWTHKQRLIAKVRRVACDMLQGKGIQDVPEVLQAHKTCFPYRDDGQRPGFAAAALGEVLEFIIDKEFPDSICQPSPYGR